jgi:hypothetical protein
MHRLMWPAILLASVPLWDGWPKGSDGLPRWPGWPPKGSDTVVGPRITVSERRPVAATEDVLNMYMNASLTPGLVATIRVAPGGIELQRARTMLVPKNPRREDTRGDRVIVRSLGQGALVSEVVVLDPAVVFLEGKTPARQEERILSVAIPTPTLVDTLEVTLSASGTATAGGESKTFDVSHLVNEYCVRAEDTPTCHLPVPSSGRP